jgi:hypothetical protein
LHADRGGSAIVTHAPAEKDGGIEYDPNGSFIIAIQLHCKQACAELLSTLSAKFALPVWLQTMKDFFLLDHGDFLTIFFGFARKELQQSRSAVNELIVRATFDAAVSASCLAGSPHHSRVSLSLNAPTFHELHDVRPTRSWLTCFLTPVVCMLLTRIAIIPCPLLRCILLSLGWNVLNLVVSLG